jgi:serine/threonine-protein phosphatase with EF-hand domain
MKEIIQKYKSQATKLLHLFEHIYSWLPVASLIDDHIFVTHGGISDITDLNKINQIKRNKVCIFLRNKIISILFCFFKYISILSPDFIIPESDEQYQINGLTNEQLLEWRQMLDLLWSDPKQTDGCEPNTYRGGGCYWGPDITKKILEKHNWTLLIRSHECKEEGFDYCHDKKVEIEFLLIDSFVFNHNNL